MTTLSSCPADVDTSDDACIVAYIVKCIVAQPTTNTTTNTTMEHELPPLLAGWA